ncbi:aminodeoxychorismate lyase [Rouxiella chamberiensis]|uniref:aminodeoxychorismate lyase n=1 Tax=Rouxiella chamberiensis TaxID=1513468 RepID=UPI0005D3CBF6|nr:aminodeoxychorismate lyase [Rouxiella chamberiensis]
MYWINGQQQDHIPVADRAVQFGDGCFTTAWVKAGNVQHVNRHLARLQHAVSHLLMPDCHWATLEAEMRAAAAGCEEGVLKVILSRGQGGRGYSSQGVVGPTRILSLSGYPQHYHRWREQGIELAQSPITLARSTLLAGIKHLNRLEQVMIRAHLDHTSAQEALVTDTSGLLVECCAANLFWRKGSAVFTPDLSHAGVNGIMRQRIIELIEMSDAFSLHIVSETPATLEDAEEVIVCNALMPILPVRKIENWHYNGSKLLSFLQPRCC